MQRELELDLLGAQAADTEGMVFVYELDGDDGSRGFERNGLTDAVVARLSAWPACVRWEARRDVRGICARADGLGDDAERKIRRQRRNL